MKQLVRLSSRQEDPSSTGGCTPRGQAWAWRGLDGSPAAGCSWAPLQAGVMAASGAPGLLSAVPGRLCRGPGGGGTRGPSGVVDTSSLQQPWEGLYPGRDPASVSLYVKLGRVVLGTQRL